MNKLEKMGIQCWRLKHNALSDEQNDDITPAPDELADVVVQLSVESDMPTESIPVAAESQPVPDKEAVISDGLDWQGLADFLHDSNQCTGCAATEPILGSGDQAAQWLFLIEAPSQHDMQRRQLLSGRSGQLFNAIMMALNLTRENAYLTTVFKCPRISAQQSPSPCGKLFQQQIKLVQPKMVVAFGEVAAQSAIRANEPLSQLRATPQQCFSNNLPIVPTHGLSEMLAEPGLKAEVWRDLKTALKLLQSQA